MSSESCFVLNYLNMFRSFILAAPRAPEARGGGGGGRRRSFPRPLLSSVYLCISLSPSPSCSLMGLCSSSFFPGLLDA